MADIDGIDVEGGGLVAEFEEAHGDGVRLLAGGAGKAEDAQGCAGARE